MEYPTVADAVIETQKTVWELVRPLGRMYTADG